MTTPGELLDRLGVRWSQVTDPSYGYSGSFTPRCAFGHWTAAAAGSDTSEDVLWARCYHACVSRSGVVKLGGWQVRQGHGGEGRSTPMRLAVSGQMSLDQLQAWQASAQADDTSSAPNQYGYGVCLDNSGVGEIPPPAQWDAWVCAMATFAVLAGAQGPGWVIDHSASTNRKIDLSGTPAVPVAQWWPDINLAIDELLRTTPPPSARSQKMYDLMRSTDGGHIFLCDGMTTRWLRTPWAVEHAQAKLSELGLPTSWWDVTRGAVESEEWGVNVGQMPW